MKIREIVFLAEGIACESLKVRESKGGTFEEIWKKFSMTKRNNF